MDEISEVELSKHTAQSGVTIEQDLNVAIGSVVYTDNDGTATSNGGSVSLFGVKIGHLDGITTYAADDALQGSAVNLTTTIDASSDGLVIGTSMDPVDIVVTATHIGGSNEDLGLFALADVQLEGDNGTPSEITVSAGGAVGNGITIDQSVRAKVGYIQWADDVDNGGGSVSVNDIQVYGTNGFNSAVDINGLTLDVNSFGDVVIVRPAIEANVWIGGIDIAENIGSVAINNIYLAPSTTFIYGH